VEGEAQVGQGGGGKTVTGAIRVMLLRLDGPMS
jgi:hypothetical protein